MKGLLDWNHLTWAHPFCFLLFLLLPLLFWWQKKKNKPLNFRVSTLIGALNAAPSWRVKWLPLLNILRVIALSGLIISLARPQSSNTSETMDSNGIDMIMSMDISGSMMAEDFKPNRLEASKKMAAEFIDNRPSDRIGLVIFSGESFTKCPVTIDHNVVKEQMAQLKTGELVDGTAIGDGLATAVDRLRKSTAKSRVIILLTDGVNNLGKVSPELALEIAKAYKIRVYAIGIGTIGNALFPMPTPNGIVKQSMPVEIDEPLLRKISKETGGEYFRATDNKSLASIYKKIDALEKTKVEINSFKHYGELFFPFALIALIALALELFLRYTVFRSLT